MTVRLKVENVMRGKRVSVTSFNKLHVLVNQVQCHDIVNDIVVVLIGSGSKS